jgi:hypothetical protein
LDDIQVDNSPAIGMASLNLGPSLGSAQASFMAEAPHPPGTLSFCLDDSSVYTMDQEEIMDRLERYIMYLLRDVGVLTSMLLQVEMIKFFRATDASVTIDFESYTFADGVSHIEEELTRVLYRYSTPDTRAAFFLSKLRNSTPAVKAILIGPRP